MVKKEQEAVVYTAHANLASTRKYNICKNAFEAGWEAAYDHLCEKPLDEMIEELSEYLKSKDNGKSE